MDPEIQPILEVWLTATVSLIFCYHIAARIPAGVPRLLCLLPVIYLFSSLPFTITNNVHIGGPTFFYLVWLGNSKLLLLAFDQGPLVVAPLSLFQFVAIGLLPINPQIQKPSNPQIDHRSVKLKRLIFVLKLILIALLSSVYKYRGSLSYYLICSLYCVHVYIAIEFVLALTATPVRYIFGYELEPQFNEPYLATSLQDFWGKRWNLMVTTILRPTVYFPVWRVSTRLLGKKWATPLGIMATFLVSGLMHELIYYYFSRAAPTWEVTCFFVLHGICVTAEVAVTKLFLRRGWLLPTAVSRVVTVGFVGVTGAWLFFPQIIRAGVDSKAINEIYMLANFLVNRIRVLM